MIGSYASDKKKRKRENKQQYKYDNQTNKPITTNVGFMVNGQLASVNLSLSSKDR